MLSLFNNLEKQSKEVKTQEERDEVNKQLNATGSKRYQERYERSVQLVDSFKWYQFTPNSII
jgi:hypothetical protein